MTRRRVAILISGRGSNMVSLIEAARAPDFPAEIALVLSNRPDAGGLDKARLAGIEALAIDHKAYATREASSRRSTPPSPSAASSSCALRASCGC